MPVSSIEAESRLALSRVRLRFTNRLARLCWQFVYVTAFRPSPTVMQGWRRFLLRSFGAIIGPGAHPYPRCRIWAPWNLTMEAHSCLANDVDCYCVDPIALGAHSIVSQYAYLCSASHDFEDPGFPLVAAPISIGQRAWVAAGAFVGPGVAVGEGALVGARAVVTKNVAPWTIVVGNPATPVRKRVLAESPELEAQ